MFRKISVALALCLALCLLPGQSAFAKPFLPIDVFAKLPDFESVVISPGGKYIAVAAPTEEQTGLVILDIQEYPDLKVVGAYKFAPYFHVTDITWASDERVLFSSNRQVGTLNVPRRTGRLYAMNADGSNRRLLFGTEQNFTFVGRGYDIISMLRDDPDHILLASYAHDREIPYAYKVNVNSGRQRRIAVGPLDNGSLFADSEGDIRFATGWTDGLDMQYAYRESSEGEWVTRTLENGDDFGVYSFAKNDRDIIVHNNRDGAMGIYRLNPASGEMAPLVLDSNVEPGRLLRDLDSRVVIGAVFEGGAPTNRFIDENVPTARLYKMLEKAFPGQQVRITSWMRDQSKAIVGVQSDRLPRDYFLFDIREKRADFLLSSRSWVDPLAMAARQPIRYEARDGLPINGYLTLPPGKEAKNLPLVTIVHGGPHGVRDAWQFDTEAQLLANRGYAVLQVNYRGSDGYGRSFEEAGWKNWGTAIQDDITDGVRWVVAEGIADPERLCIYGASFGGYSVLQSLTREPDLYRCGFAFVGVYDLNLMYKKGDIPEHATGISYLDRVLGTDPEVRAQQSPLNYVDKIRTPLYVAHGKEDVRAHVEHYYQLTKALDKAKIPYEKMLVKREGHGFYDLENRIRFYTELVNFIDAHIGD